MEEGKLHQLEADPARVNRVSMMGELAASLAHEIKQPVAAAVSNAEACLHWIARDQPDLGEAHEAATETVKEARRAADIITGSVHCSKKSSQDASRWTSTKSSLRWFPSFAKRPVATLSRCAPLLCSNMPRVSADRVQLEQVLMNLMLMVLKQ